MLLALMLGCRPPHQTLPTTPASLTPAERVETFNRFVAWKEHWLSQNGAVVNHYVSFQNGWEVYYPEDLIPVVGEDSSTAKHARVAARARAKQIRWERIGLAGLLGGFVVWVSPIVTDSDPTWQPKVAIALAVAGLVAYGAMGTYYRLDVNRETHAAYEAYDDDLAARLQICVAGLQVVPCESVAPQPQTQQPPSPTGNGGYYGTEPKKQ
jgi:hypothetical protein